MKELTFAEEIARVEFHIRLRAAHPVAFFALMKLNTDIDALRNRLGSDQFEALRAEDRQARNARKVSR